MVATVTSFTLSNAILYSLLAGGHIHGKTVQKADISAVIACALAIKTSEVSYYSITLAECVHGASSSTNSNALSHAIIITPDMYYY